MSESVSNIEAVLKNSGLEPEVTPRAILFSGGRVIFTPSIGAKFPRNIAVIWDDGRAGDFDLAVMLARILIKGFDDAGVMRLQSIFSSTYQTDDRGCRINECQVSLQITKGYTVLDFLFLSSEAGT